MLRVFAFVSLCLVLGSRVTAQCIDVTPGVTIGSGDNTLFATHYPLGFNMPVANSALGTYSHFRVCTNGWIILTNGTTTPSGTPATTNYGSAASLAGTVSGHAPRIVPFWKNMYVWGQISYDNTTAPGSLCRILFADTKETDVATTATPKFCEVILHANGDIDFSFPAGMEVEGDDVAYCGVSCANGQVAPAAADLSASPSTAGVGCVWQSFAAPSDFDLGGDTVHFAPDGIDGWNVTISCSGGTVDSTGEGTYGIISPAETIAAPAADAAITKGNFENHSLRLNKSTRGATPSGLSPEWDAIGLFFIPPSLLATALPPTDDGWHYVVPSMPFPLADGSTCPGFAVSHNGIITLGTYPNNGSDFTPTVPELAATIGQAIYSWHDFNDTEPGSGSIKFEEVGNVLTVTWDGVENLASPEVANPSTVQFQFDLVTGSIAVLWVVIDGNVSGPGGGPTLVGYTGPGVSPNPGSIAIPQGLPAFVPHNVFPLTLSADTAPVCTPTSGATVTYTTKNMVEFAPGSSIFLGMLIFSFGSIPPTDLGFLGAPGVTLHLASFDILFGIVGTSRVQQTPITFPAGTPAGLTLYAQTLNLFDPAFPLPNGMNPLGAIMSNALINYVNTF